MTIMRTLIFRMNIKDAYLSSLISIHQQLVRGTGTKRICFRLMLSNKKKGRLYKYQVVPTDAFERVCQKIIM
jgi:hypothetical protein